MRRDAEERDRYIDGPLLIAVFGLLAIGGVMVFSASAFHAQKATGDTLFYLKRHLLFSAIGLAAMFVVSKIDYHLLGRLAYPLLLMAAVLLAGVLVFGNKAGGATRWFRLGPVSFQPSELAKLAVVIYLSHSLTRKREKMHSFSFGFLPHVVMCGTLILLVLVEPDLGTAALLALLLFSLLFVAGTKISYLLGAALLALPVLYHQIMSTPWRKARMMVFLDPWADRFGIGYQVTESLIAFGSGGATGVGLGDGRQKLFFLPASHTDFIFSILGEELGFIGAALILLLFGILVYRGLKIAMNAADLFGTYLALGITLTIGFQATANMAVALGLLPTKGLALPFMSYGGSSLVSTLIGIGILLSVAARERPEFARRARKPAGVYV
ncbi:MAG: putative lipid II flippase FtsW [Deltaproteobacteria bacterium]|nr:putative lipid II flippase FtsW [Deltaproteobacteria bacterium]